MEQHPSALQHAHKTQLKIALIKYFKSKSFPPFLGLALGGPGPGVLVLYLYPVARLLFLFLRLAFCFPNIFCFFCWPK